MRYSYKRLREHGFSSMYGNPLPNQISKRYLFAAGVAQIRQTSPLCDKGGLRQKRGGIYSF